MNELSLTPLLESYARVPSPGLMEQLVEGFLPLSHAIARRFMGHGVELEDLQQVAAMALMKAIERFQPERGLKFTTFAAPTITGEVRNYIRDKGSIMRMSRDARSQLYKMQQVQDRLTQQLQREPTMREVADAMGVTYDELLSWLDQREMMDVSSLSETISGDDERDLEARLGVTESGYEQVEQREWLKWVFSQVTPDERRLLELRFIHRMGQRETARMMNVSQMQVSRLERRVLARLRESSDDWRASRES